MEKGSAQSFPFQFLEFHNLCEIFELDMKVLEQRNGRRGQFLPAHCSGIIPLDKLFWQKAQKSEFRRREPHDSMR